MDITAVIAHLESKNLSYKEELKAFLTYYQQLLEQLRQQSSVEMSHRLLYSINSLIDWTEEEGNVSFYKAIDRLNEKTCDKLKGFVNLYTFLLKKVEGDVAKLIDQLFFIPRQFEKEFLGKNVIESL